MRRFKIEEFSAPHQLMFCFPCCRMQEFPVGVWLEGLRNIPLLVQISFILFPVRIYSLNHKDVKRSVCVSCATFSMNLFHLTLSSGLFLSFAEKKRFFFCLRQTKVEILQIFNLFQARGQPFLFQLFVFASAFSHIFTCQCVFFCYLFISFCAHPAL